MPAEHLAPFITSIVGALAVLFGAVQWQQGRLDAKAREKVAAKVERESDEHDDLLDTNAALGKENLRLRGLIHSHEAKWAIVWTWITLAWVWIASTHSRVLQVEPAWPLPPPLPRLATIEPTDSSKEE